ncbi:MAG: nucleoside triphosphate pyrophosphohydrolase [Candidatus Abyssobacteria bacterium SURF_17]|uniref:Nucleoside triphosphate pyrophosphohydrolase n=1 Tax=Candidatus Abyssobacteria bacterium SURF_17 TaxID=2093361 RepID=A0A419F6F0_9BACT|nr:MAG: nucleoside triphosphate pyrophosphohydrolase [Candidatus Abyssubacteria bacterium SURF_17]
MTDDPKEYAAHVANSFAALYELAQYLRSEHGCPWDRAQGLESMLTCLREETEELEEAVTGKEANGISEEWGDLLFILLMFAVIAEESHGVTAAEAMRAIEAKMIRRHPHVFGSSAVGAVEDTISQWERIKAKEKAHRQESLMDDMPMFYSALKRASHVQEVASGVGFDWSECESILKKIEEETEELREALAAGDTHRTGAELGDLLFSCVNLARFMRMDAELLLSRTVDKFIERFKYIETELRRTGKSLSDASLQEMDDLWERSKTDRKRE